MMKYTNLYLRLCAVIVGILAIVSCESTVDTYSEFIGNETILDIGGPNGVSSRVGRGKVILELAISSDPRITHGTVEWTERGIDFVERFDVDRTETALDTLEIPINDVLEGSLRFTFTLFDKEENASKQLSHTRVIYGDEYEAGLIARRIDFMEAFSTLDPVIDSVSIKWNPPLEETLESIFTYTNELGVVVEEVIERDVLTSFVKGYDRSIPFSVITRYIPEPNALDTYISSESTGEFPKIEVYLDKSTWSSGNLTSDIPEVNGGFNAMHMWDGVPGTWHATLGGAKGKRLFTIALGAPAPVELTAMEWEGFGAYRPVSVKDYQVWGIDDITDADTVTDINVDADAWEAEMESKGWVKLLVSSRTQGDDSSLRKISNEYKSNFVRVVILSSFDPFNPDIAWGEFSLKGFK